MCQNRDVASMKEIQHPIVHTPAPDSQLVDAIPQKVRMRTPEFMPERSQEQYTGKASVETLRVTLTQLAQPVEHRHSAR